MTYIEYFTYLIFAADMVIFGAIKSPNESLIYRVSQEECARIREGVSYVKEYRYNPKHLRPNLNGYGDNGQRSLKL